MVHHLLPLLPPHTVYCEPYAGGASLFFARERPAPTNTHYYHEVLNDHDQRLITVYRVCQDATTRHALLDRLTYTPYARAEYAKALAIIRRGWDEADDVTRAWAMVVSLQQSFANKLNAGWGVRVAGRNGAASWANWRETLPLLMERLRDVHLECDDALAVIRRWDSPQTLFYGDPPYPGADQGHYQGFTKADLKALVETLETCQGSVLLSGYASDLIPSTWEHVTFEVYSSASGQGKTHGHSRGSAATSATLGDRRRTEHVWRIDRSAGMRPELKAVLFGASPRPLPLFDEP